MIARILLALTLCAPAVAMAQEADFVGPGISSFRTGIFCAPEVVETRPAPDTVAGITNVILGEPDFVSSKRNVPAVMGMGFGIKSTAKGFDMPDVIVTTTHPPMGDRGVTQQSFASTISSTGTSLTLYQFDYPYELVLGRWTITARQGSAVLFRASFNVVPPQMVPELAEVCDYEDLLS